MKSAPLLPEEAMNLAIAQARKGGPFVSPNPLVGCVIVDREHRLLSMGHHPRVGERHAEVDAVQNVVRPEDLTGATVYVTLEPCAHQGRTPSCAHMLAKLPLKKVIYGVEDPFGPASGGAGIVRAAGIEAERFSGLQTELSELCEVFLFNVKERLPFVALKVATSLDGALAFKTGESQWITGELSRAHTHYLRAVYDATLVGVGTFLQDNPRLNVRLSDLTKQNKVVVLDPQGRGFKQFHASRLRDSHAPENIFWVTGNKELQSEACQLVHVDVQPNGELSIEQVLKALWDRQVRSVMVEGGARTLSLFLREKAYRRIHLFIAPTLFGGVNGKPWTEHYQTESFAGRPYFHVSESRVFGEDTYLSLRLKTAGAQQSRSL